MPRSTLCLTLLTFTLLLTDVQASATLDKIKKSGTIKLGVRDASMPFSYLDSKQQYVGYSVDLCLAAVQAIKKKTSLNTLKVKFVPVTPATRLPLTINGTIDISCDSTVNTPERDKQVAFSTTMFVVNNGFLSKKSANLKNWMDLKGKTIAATSGTINLQFIAQLNKQHNLGIKIVPMKDHGEAFLMVETGRAAAYVMEDILLASLRANAKTPDDYVIYSDTKPLGPYGLVLRRHDDEFKHLVDQALTDLYKSGEINSIYKKWFQSAIPPKGINLNWPMSAALKKVIAQPTDSSNLAAYQ